MLIVSECFSLFPVGVLCAQVVLSPLQEIIFLYLHPRFNGVSQLRAPHCLASINIDSAFIHGRGWGLLFLEGEFSFRALDGWQASLLLSSLFIKMAVLQNV